MELKTYALTVYTDRDCPACGGEFLELPEVTYVPLFRDAGYGEATRVRVAICLGCWMIRELSRETINPRAYVD